jgi:hypothetical protein
MLPVALDLCAAASALPMSGNLATVLAVALLHTAAMLACGVTLAWLVYRWLGLRFITRSWFNLDFAWALSLLVSGAVGVALAATAPA